MENWIFSIFPNETFVDLGLYQFGWEKCNPSHSFGPAARNHFLFHYVISGTGELRANDAKGVTHVYQIKSGQGFMIFPGQITTYTADRNLPWEYAWLEFDGLRVKEALSFIEQNFQNDISVEDIASTCGLNRSYFGKIFKNAVGKSPQEFLLNYRMIKASELLKLTQLSIGDISTAVGYANQLHFSRAFKNIYGISPREWRKQNRLSI